MRRFTILVALSSLAVACKGEPEPTASSSAKAEAGEKSGEKAGAVGGQKGTPKGQDKVDAFTEYQRKSMASEAQVNLAALGRAAQAYVQEERMDPGTMTVTTGTLPPSAPMTPPAGSCCKQEGGKCPAKPGQWEHETWKALMFEPVDATRYSYEVVTEGEKIILRAAGDLDCDGTLSSYEIAGTMVDGALQLSPLASTDPLE